MKREVIEQCANVSMEMLQATLGDDYAVITIVACRKDGDDHKAGEAVVSTHVTEGALYDFLVAVVNGKVLSRSYR